MKSHLDPLDDHEQYDTTGPDVLLNLYGLKVSTTRVLSLSVSSNRFPCVDRHLVLV